MTILAMTSMTRRARTMATRQWGPVEDGADPTSPDRDRGATRHRVHVQADDCEEAAAPADRVDQIVLSLSARGLATGGDLSAFSPRSMASVSQETVSKITGQVLEEMGAWMSRPLDQGEMYPVIFIDAIVVKVGDGQVRNKPIRSATTCDRSTPPPPKPKRRPGSPSSPRSGSAVPAIKALWQNAWSEFVPFLDYDVEIFKIICSTNAIESLNARYRQAVRVRGDFPNEQAAMKCLYLTTRSLDPTGKGRTRWATRWKPALNAFAITFEARIPTR
jgi:transposase-like protein